LDNITDHFVNRPVETVNNQSHGHSHSECLSPVIEINRRQVFSLEEAQEVLPVIFRITKASSQKVNALIERLESLNSSHGGSHGAANEELTNSIEGQVNTLIQDWQNKIQKLGALPKGLWIADFDAGDGYFCWKFPERSIEFWHRYSDGFSKRMHVGDRCQHISLQDRLKQKIFSITPQLTP
jgi:hypothetical protein